MSNNNKNNNSKLSNGLNNDGESGAMLTFWLAGLLRPARLAFAFGG
jgi:hypothetical protein